MRLTTSEMRVYAVVGLVLVAIVAAVVFDLYLVLLWLAFISPPAFAVALGLTLWRGTRR